VVLLVALLDEPIDEPHPQPLVFALLLPEHPQLHPPPPLLLPPPPQPQPQPLLDEPVCFRGVTICVACSWYWTVTHHF
jgi:hypothetical protein